MRTLAALAAAAMLAGPFCLPAQAGNGEEPASAPPPAQAPSPQASPQASPQTGTPPQEPAQAGDWETLWTWIGENRNEGGTIRLTGDVTVPANMAGENWDYSPGRGSAGITVDCGEHTLYIADGALLLLEGGKITFTGAGGEHGLVHIRSGGYLSANAITLRAAGGNALVQEEGAWAGVEQWDESMKCTLEGDLVWAEKPVLSAEAAKTSLAAIPEGAQAGAEHLPQRVDRMRLNYKGGVIRVEGAAAWDLSAPSLADRERTLLEGALTGSLTVDGMDEAMVGQLGLTPQLLTGEACVSQSGPKCLAVFPVDGAALAECSFERKGDKLTAKVWYLFAGAPQEARLLWSADEGDSWQTADRTETPGSGEGDFTTVWWDGAPPNDAWFLVELVYLQADGTQRLVHTDTVVMSREGVLPMPWADGNRGGGEQIVTPPVTPPTVLPPDGFYGGQEQTPPTPSAPQEPEGPSGEPARPEEPQVPQEPEETPPSQLGEPDQTETPGVHTGQTAPPVEGEDPAEDPPPQETAPVDGPASGGPVSNGAASRDPSSAQAAAETTLPEGEPPAAEPSPGPGQDTEHGTAAQEDPAHSGAPAESGQPEPAASAPAEADGETAPSAPAEGTEKEADGETASGLSPAAQIAVGLAAVAAVAAGAVAALNPGLVRRLFRRGKPRS